jgi:hypothetical protein
MKHYFIKLGKIYYLLRISHLSAAAGLSPSVFEHVDDRRTAGAIALIDHRLHDAAASVYEPANNSSVVLSFTGYLLNFGIL